MPRARVGRDEWYPVFSLSDFDSDPEVEFSDEELARLTRLFSEFDEVQDWLADKWDEAGGYGS